MICSRCKKRPAVVFITRMEGDKSINDGLCLVCAKELGIKPVEDVLHQMGISDEDVEQMDEQLTEMMAQTGEDGEEGFVPGGAATFPFLQQLFGNLSGGDGGTQASPGRAAEADDRAGEKEKKKKTTCKKYDNRSCTLYYNCSV